MSSSQRNTNNNHAPAAIPVNLGKPSLRLRLEAYYQLVSPQQLSDDWKDRFAQIWSKYGGTVEGERQLAKKLHKKYGTQVLLQLTEGTQPSATTKQQKTTTSDSSSQQYTEEWYELRTQERDSGVIDFTSPCFDPVAALQQSLSVVAETNVPAFTLSQQRLERVDQFRPYLPVNDPQYRVVPMNNHTLRRDTSQPVPQRAALCWESAAMPSYTLLYRAMHSNQKIRVVVRYVDGMRGTITGQLLAYDKHFNLILQRAQETYSPRMPVVHHEEETTSTTTARTVDREIARRQAGGNRRSLAQVLVRGDNVVLVYWATEEQSSQRGAISRYRPQAPKATVGSVGFLKR